MQPKYPGTNVPVHSSFVPYDGLDDVHEVHDNWHAVHWPRQSHTQDLIAYTYADDHFKHAWTVDEDTVWFEDASEAVQFALLFGGAL
jgi:hypothetical protein